MHLVISSYVSDENMVQFNGFVNTKKQKQIKSLVELYTITWTLIIEIIGLLLSLVLVLFLNVLILIKLFSIHHFYGLLLL